MIIDNPNREYFRLSTLIEPGFPRLLSNFAMSVEVKQQDLEDKIYLTAWIPRGKPEDIVVESSAKKIKVKVNNLKFPFLTGVMELYRRVAKVDEITSSFDPFTRLLHIEVPLEPKPAYIDIPVQRMKG